MCVCVCVVVVVVVEEEERGEVGNFRKKGRKEVIREREGAEI